MLTLNIITITYNPSLDELNQTYSSLFKALKKVEGKLKFRVILKDAVSNNLEEITKLLKIFPHSIEFESKKDKGISDGWNQAISKVVDGYILLLNSGDLLHENYFNNWIMKQSQNQRIDNDTIYCCEVNIIRNGKLISKVVPKIKKDNFYFGIGFGHPGVILNKLIYDRVGVFNKDLKIAMDFDFLIRCFKQGVKVMPFEGKIYMEADGVSTNNLIKTHMEVFNVLINNNHNYLRSFFTQILIVKLRYFKRIVYYFRNELRAVKYLFLALYNFCIKILLLFRQKSILKIMGIHIGKGSSISLRVKFLGFNTLKIGKNTIINSGVILDNRGDISIGNNVSISRNVQILSGSHDVKSPFFDYESGKVNIDDYCVIFTSAIILPNTHIKEKSVISSAAIVSGIIPKNTLYFDRNNIKNIDRENIRYNLEGNVFFT
jgi:acetyltransferase-like isoleucine patch superfamily enzyme